VIAVKPPASATGVPIGSKLEVFLDEPVLGSSITPNSIKVYAGGGRVRGRVVVYSDRHLVFDPARLVKGTRYRVVVRDLRDSLGNVGPRKQWSFTTEAPPPKPKPR
jgi:hypothetical protein